MPQLLARKRLTVNLSRPANTSDKLFFFDVSLEISISVHEFYLIPGSRGLNVLRKIEVSSDDGIYVSFVPVSHNYECPIKTLWVMELKYVNQTLDQSLACLNLPLFPSVNSRIVFVAVSFINCSHSFILICCCIILLL
jgi:hypothetical protein